MVDVPVELVVLGSTNTDIVVEAEHLPLPGETVLTPGYAIYAGGKAANQAVAAARAGATVRFVGAVGSDAYGADRLADLADAGVNVDAVERLDGMSSGVAIIVVDASGENLIINAAGANLAISAGQVRRGLEDVLHGLLLMTLEAPLEAMREAVRIAAERRWRVIVNAAPFVDGAIEILEAADVLVCNHVEARQADPSASWQDPEQAARHLAERFDCSVVVTVGRDGCVVADDDGSVAKIPGFHVEALDSTGAGDAFCGVLAAELASGASLTEACKVGTAAAAISVTRRGAQASMPDYAAIQRFIEVRRS